MLLFRSEEEVHAWCGATGEARGEVVPLAGVWALAQA
jgi:Alkylmercury lyase